MSLLELTAVSLAFDGVRAVDNVTTAVEAGQITAVIGPNGAGKTTLMNVICGIVPPAAGTIHFRGRDVTGWPTHRIAALGMARTFQNLELFAGMTVRQHLLVGRHRLLRSGLLASAFRLPRHSAEEQRQHRVVQALLDRCELSDYADRAATSLPYGLQRRVELARALASEPTLLLLDEPMAGLSGEEARAVSRAVKEVAAAGPAVLLVEHDMEVVMSLSDRVLVLAQGALIAAGTPAEIQRDANVVNAYLGEVFD